MGRPKRKRIEVVFDEARQRWRADVPPSIAGKRMRRFFESESGARSWAIDREVEFSKGSPAQFDKDPVSADRDVRSVMRRYLLDKSPEVSAGHAKLIKNHLEKFMARFGGLDVDSIDPLACRQWILRLPGSQRTRHGIFSTCRTAYRWAMRYGLASSSPFDRMEPVPAGDAPKGILEPKEMAALLAMDLPAYVRAWLVLGGFGGLRPAEIARSSWDALNWETGEFHVTPDAIKRERGKRKGIRERMVKLPDAAIRLCPRGLSGPIIPVSKNTFQMQIRKLAVALAEMRGTPLRKVKAWRRGKQTETLSADWPHDCCRHSAATYMLAVERDAWKVAQWLGHTTAKMVHDHYALPKSIKSAHEWWAIGLESTGDEKIIPIKTASFRDQDTSRRAPALERS